MEHPRLSRSAAPCTPSEAQLHAAVPPEATRWCVLEGPYLQCLAHVAPCFAGEWLPQDDTQLRPSRVGLQQEGVGVGVGNLKARVHLCAGFPISHPKQAVCVVDWAARPGPPLCWGALPSAAAVTYTLFWPPVAAWALPVATGLSLVACAECAVLSEAWHPGCLASCGRAVSACTGVDLVACVQMGARGSIVFCTCSAGMRRRDEDSASTAAISAAWPSVRCCTRNAAK